MGREILVAIAEVIFAQLAGGVAERFECLSNGDVTRMRTDRRAGNTYLRHAGALRRLGGDEGRSSCGTTVFRIVIGEEFALFGDAVDVRSFITKDGPEQGQTES
jgi:hypothetical protein